jgi:Icc-related predicted phosphoesterase
MTTPNKLTVVAISDTHGRHDMMKHPVPDGDVLIHAGDFTGRGLMSEAIEFAEWLDEFPHNHKLIVPGNHDGIVEVEPDWAKDMFGECGIELLLHETVEIGGFKFFGSPFTPAFLNWHFMRARGAELRGDWQDIDLDTDVVITHGPAYGHGDLVPAYKGEIRRLVGCLELLRRLKDVRPRYHIFGHIHDGHGLSASDEVEGTVFANVSICDERYRPQNKPFVFQLE